MGKGQQERRKKHEAITIVLPAIKRVIKDLENVTQFSEKNSRLPINFQEKEDFHIFTILALTALKLGLNSEKWREKVNQRRLQLKADMIAYDDIISAIEVDEVYIDFLMNIGKVELAINIARQITHGYRSYKPNTLEGQQFPKKKPRALTRISYELIRKGKLEKAAEVIKEVKVQERHLYFGGLIDHYKATKDADKIEDLIKELDTLIDQVKENEDPLIRASRMLVALRNQARGSLASIKTQDGDLEDALLDLEKIDFGRHRLREKIKFAQKLLENSKINEARELILSIINDINNHTPEYSDERSEKNEDEFDETIGSLSFLPKKETPKNEEYELRNYDRVEILSSVAKIIANYPQLEDLFDYCVYGSDTSSSIETSIYLSTEKGQPHLWTEFMGIFEATGDKDQLHDTYQRGCQIYPEHIDSLSMEYAYFLYGFDQEEALNVILANPDLEKRAHGFADFIRVQIEEKGFSNWQAMITKLIEIEDEILSLQEPENEFNIEDLLSVEEDEEEEPDKQAIVSVSSGGLSVFFTPNESKFWRRSPGLLANLAKIAIIQGEWDIFCNIIKDNRMTPDLKVHVLNEVTECLLDGEEITFWF